MTSKIYIALLFLCLLFACRREEPTTWTPAFKGPIAHGSLGAADLLPSSYFYQDANDLWHFYYTQNLTDLDIDSLVEIPDTTIHRSFTLPFTGGPFNIAAGTQLYNQTQNNVLQTQGALLKEVDMKSGTLEYTFVSYVNGELTTTCTLPGITLNGQPIILQVTTPPTANELTPSSTQGFIDLANYHIDLTGSNGSSYNTIENILEIRVADNAALPAQVYGNDSVTFDLKFIDAKIKYGEGYFGQHTYTIDETVPFGGDFDMPDGQIMLNEATFALSLKNYVGVDFKMKINDLTAIQNDHSVTLDYSPIYQWQNFTRAQDNIGVVTPTVQSYVVHENNSNLTDFIGVIPHELHLSGEMLINVLGNISLNNDFIYTEQTIEAMATLDIPLQLATSAITFTDSIDLTNEAIDLVANGQIKMVLDNYFPCEVLLNARLQDGTYENNLIEELVIAGSTNGQAVRSIAPIVVTNEILQHIRNGAQIILSVTLSTSNYPTYQSITSQQRVDYILIGEGDVQLEYE